MILNAMTVDLEDWPQAVLDPRLEPTEHVVVNLERVLSLLNQHQIRATFFALGQTCRRFPQLLPRIAAAGHEVASHGWSHELVYRLSPQQFDDELGASVELIRSQTGQWPLGYRAPAFSITERSLWARPILARHGFRYSSSVFPIRKRRYGIADAPRHPYRWSDCDLIEVPMATYRLAGRNIPVCGGGYTRLFPAALHIAAVRQLNRLGHPAVVYLHPYELAASEVTDFRRAGLAFSWKRSVMQSLGRNRVPARLARLFRQFSFGPICDVLKGCEGLLLPAGPIIPEAASVR